MPPPIRILMINEDPAEQKSFRKILSDERQQVYQIEYVDHVDKAVDALKLWHFDLIILDISTPGHRGMPPFKQLKREFPEIPIVILDDKYEEEVALRSLQQGAQDYLVKGEFDHQLFIRVIRYSIERHRMEAMLRNMALIDELTGIYNRRGFNLLLDQQLALAKRQQRKLLLLLFDLNDFKSINDRFGHLEGDHALKAAADVLKKTFRGSDVIARLGGDEFAVVSIDFGSAIIDRIFERLKMRLRDCNSSIKDYEISFAIGYTLYDALETVSQEDLIKEADRMLYEDKAFHKTNSFAAAEEKERGKKSI